MNFRIALIAAFITTASAVAAWPQAAATSPLVIGDGAGHVPTAYEVAAIGRAAQLAYDGNAAARVWLDAQLHNVGN